MKPKENQALKGHFSSKAISLLLLMLCLICALPISASALEADSSIINENYNLIKEYCLSLDGDISSYSTLDDSPDKSTSRSVAAIINSYQSELRSLQSHPDVGKRPLTAEIDLAFAKARAAGKLAWIYHYNIAEISNAESILFLQTLYESYANDIDKSVDAAVLNAYSDRISSDMNRSVFRQKTANLAKDGDSVQATAIILEAVDGMEHISSTDLFGENFKIIYDSARQKLELQRGRDSATAQMKEIFAAVRPGESYNDNKIAATLTYRLKNAESVSEINMAMCDTLAELTATDESEKYTYEYISRLNEQVSDTVIKANKIGKVGEFSSIFKGHTLESKRAYTKDRIAELIFKKGDPNDSELKAIESLFNGASGRVDACDTQSALEGELIRAEYRKKLWSALTDTRKSLSIVLGKYDSSTFSQRLDASYDKSALSIDKLASSSADLRGDCEALLKSGKESLSSILNEAKAERFLLDNKDIIKKPAEELDNNDDVYLKAALADYIYLESEVRAALASQINSIAEKYKIILSKKIRSLCGDDAFFQDICEIICAELNSLPTISIDDFYNNTDLVLKKAYTLQVINSYYRDVTSREEYSLFSSEEKDVLSSACKQASEELGAADISKTDVFEVTLSEIASRAKLSLDRTSQYARVRISAASSTNEEITKILAEALTKINACTDKSEMVAIADSSIFKIQRYLTIDEIALRSKEYQDLLASMSFLEESESSGYINSIKSLTSAATGEAGLAENITVLSFVWNKFIEGIDEVVASANGIDLARGIEHYSALADKKLESLKIEIRGLVYLKSESCDEYLNSLTLLHANFKSDISTCKTSEDIKSLYDETLAGFDLAKNSAEAENLKEYKIIIEAQLESLKNVEAKYSAENYNKIISIIEESKENLATCKSLEECTSLLDSTKERIAEVNDLLDDARDSATAILNALLESCKKEPLLYSAENLERIETICNESLNAINEFESIEDIPALNTALEEGLALIKRIPRDRIFTSESAFGITDEGAKYPDGYDMSIGYLASITAPNGISSEATLSVIGITPDKDIKSIIRAAAKKSALKIYGSAPDNTLKLLKQCDVAQGLNINLSVVTADASAYTLRLLLTEDLRDENVLGIVYVGSDGSVEFFSAQRSDMLLTAKLSRLGEFYIVCENTVNLSGLIIFLIILLIFELVALCFFIFLRKNRTRKEPDMLPDSFNYAFAPLIPFSLLRVTPSGAVGITLVLSVAALTLGFGVALLARAELGALKKQNQAPQPQRSATPDQKRLAKRDVLLLKEKTYLLEEKKRQPVYCATAPEREPHNAFIEREDTPSKVYEQSAQHKAEINLDVIAEKFTSGELVTPEALKRKRLIPKKTDYVKILARGRLEKPLLIEAHDFSRAAEEMLIAAGGEAIRIKP